MPEDRDRLAWLKEIFDKKRKEEEKERARVEAERQRRTRFLTLLPDFWEKVKADIYAGVDFYNRNVRQTEWLSRHDVGRDVFLIEKNTEPAARLEVGLNRNTEEIACHFEYANLPEMSLKVRVGDQGLYLESEGQPIPDADIAMWVLKDLIHYVLR